jgi:N-acetylmuramate 1-kinase
MEQRHDQFYSWVKSYAKVVAMQPIPGDASARHYFRVILADQTLIGVNAPPTPENTVGFTSIARAFTKLGLNVPQVQHMNSEQGFLLISDLGDAQLFKVINPSNVNQYYMKALRELIKIHRCYDIPNWQLPTFDRPLLFQELERFHEWYLQRHLGLSLTLSELAMLQEMYDQLINDAITQPQVCVHRDYHCRNLMVMSNNEIGLLDFQDAVMGPITYDLVSLLRDCYIAWPIEKVYDWVSQFWERLVAENDLRVSQDEFIKWFDWIGLQRHLKVLGIFARLYRRDNKSGYIQDIPRVLQYVLYICGKYQEFRPLYDFLQLRVMVHESNDPGSRQGQSTAASHG